MPHSRQAKKRDRQNEERRLHNKAIKSAMRTQVKKVEQALADGDKETAAKELPEAMMHLDKAAKRRVIHPNKAARDKSRLQRRVNEI